jgi:hypothetical protein
MFCENYASSSIGTFTFNMELNYLSFVLNYWWEAKLRICYVGLNTDTIPHSTVHSCCTAKEQIVRATVPKSYKYCGDIYWLNSPRPLLRFCPSFQFVDTLRSLFALQPLAYLQFTNLNTIGMTPWTGDQPNARPLPNRTQNKRTHSCYFVWDYSDLTVGLP